MTENFETPWSRPWGFSLPQLNEKQPRIHGGLFPPCSPAMRAIQARLWGRLRLNGFRRSGRHFNRKTGDGLTQVISFQSGAGWMDGEFTINIGIFIPEAHSVANDWPETAIVRDVDCAIWTRLGELDAKPDDLWWPVQYTESLIWEIDWRLQTEAFVFFERFASRDLCLKAAETPDLSEWQQAPDEVMAAIRSRSGFRTLDE
jgi:hypothetical protein